MSEIHVQPRPLSVHNWIMIIAGSALYALSVNLFLSLCELVKVNLTVIELTLQFLILGIKF